MADLIEISYGNGFQVAVDESSFQVAVSSQVLETNCPAIFEIDGGNLTGADTQFSVLNGLLNGGEL